MSELVQIDGSFGEGGGQILRTSVSLAAITGRPVEIVNIRAGRAKPGLQAQHLASVRAAARLCGAEMRGDATGSVYLRFEPTHGVRSGEYRFDIGTAGATTLVAQTVLIPLALASAESSVVITGGTHNPMAPTADYLEHVFMPMLRAHGYTLKSSFGPPGFFPRGGGEFRLDIGAATQRTSFRATESVGGEPTAYIVTCSLDASVADRAGKAINARSQMRVVKRVESGPSAGAAVTIVAGSAGFTSLGERGKRMEKVADEAVDDYLGWIAKPAAVDEHLSDQLVLPALFAQGSSSWQTNRITEHLRTGLWVAKQFFEIETQVDETAGTVIVTPES